MKAHIALGAELDVLSKGEFDEGLDDALDFLKKDKTVRPHYFVQSGAIPIVGPFTGICEIGSPATGRLWNVLGFSICGETDVVTSAAGTVALYIGDRPVTGPPMLSQLRTARLTVPASADYNPMAQWCPSAHSVFFNLVGITTITQFVGNVYIAEYREDDILDRTGR